MTLDEYSNWPFALFHMVDGLFFFFQIRRNRKTKTNDRRTDKTLAGKTLLNMSLLIVCICSGLLSFHLFIQPPRLLFFCCRHTVRPSASLANLIEDFPRPPNPPESIHTQRTKHGGKRERERMCSYCGRCSLESVQTYVIAQFSLKEEIKNTIPSVFFLFFTILKECRRRRRRDWLVGWLLLALCYIVTYIRASSIQILYTPV